MILILELTAAEKETLLDLLATVQDEGYNPSASHKDFMWQSKILGRLRHKVEVQIREQQRDPDLR